MWGYPKEINHAGASIQQTAVGILSQVYCRGISLGMYGTFDANMLPHAKLHVSRIRYAKDDFLSKQSLYKGYTGITELDM